MTDVHARNLEAAASAQKNLAIQIASGDTPSEFAIVAALHGGAAIMANVADGFRREQMRRDELAEARAAESVPGTGRAAGKHRHKFDAAGVCQCGKAKSAAGRKPAAADVPPPVDPRQQPFKPIGTADNFADGGMGSSGMKR
jgi:hypothetical protein